MITKKANIFKSISEKLGFDRTLFMVQFIKGSWIFFIVGILLTTSYRFIESIVLGQLYAATASINQTNNIISIFPNIGYTFLGVIGLVLMSSIGIAILERTLADIDMKFRKALLEKTSKIPLSVWHSRHSGDYMAIVGRDADKATEAYKYPFISLIGTLFEFIGGLIIILPRFPEMAYFSIGAGFFYMLIALTMRKKTRAYAAKQRQFVGEAASSFTDVINGLQVIRVFKMLSLAKKRHDNSTEELYKYGMKAGNITILSGALDQLGYTIAYTGALIFGLFMVNKGTITLPGMLAYWPVSMGISYGLMHFALIINEYQIIVVAVDRVMNIFKLPEESNGNITNILENDIAVEFSNVSYSYGDNKVLDNISFKINKGETVALVGSSGGGKSTLLKLMMKLYDVNSGIVRVSGIPVSEYTLDALRSQFSYVPQTPYLINDSIYENIAIVKDNASMQNVATAAKQAYCDDFINNLPQNYNTIIGGQGVGLSGGQKQRITIARAFIKNAPIFLFDEATSALDGDSEMKIGKSIDDLSNNRTVVIVAHRLSTAKKADRIIVIEQGKVVEEGSHEKLLASEGKYASLWLEQQAK